MIRNDGGPAFPTSGAPMGRSGMSLRDWFAGQSLLVAAHQVENTLGKIEAQSIAERAYKMADAMLAARDGKESP